MSKMKLFKQAEQMYLKGSTVSEISLELGIAKRTLFYWKKKYDWDKKRQESMYDRTQFKEDCFTGKRNMIGIKSDKNLCMTELNLKRICKNLPKNLWLGLQTANNKKSK